MNRKLYLFAVLICVISHLSAEVSQNNEQLVTTVELSQGYRRDNLEYKYNSKNSRDFSARDKYKNIDTYTTRLVMQVRKNDFFIKGLGGYGNVYQGKFHEKTKSPIYPYSHLTSHVKGDYTLDLNLAFGKDFFIANDWKISPSIGYGVYVQDFHTNDAKGYITFNTRSLKVVRRSTLRGFEKSRYKAIWYSPQFSLGVQKALTSTLKAYVSYTFLFPLNYSARSKAKYNTKFRLNYNTTYRYQQNNKAYTSLGNICAVGLNWNFAKGWAISPEIEVMKFFSKGGNSDMNNNLKKVTRSAAEYRLVLSYIF